ncbi:MAG: hypothetical protein WAW93_01070 [Streptococcus suis]
MYVVVLNQLYLFYKKKKDLNSTVAFLVCLFVLALPNAQDFHGLLGLIAGAFVIVYLGSFVYSRLDPKRRSVK